MKKITCLSFIMILFISPINALEKSDCSGFKKLSKEQVNCKKNNFKAGMISFGQKIKSGAKKIKVPQKGIKFGDGGMTKQYPKGSQK